jgi:WD40-like Beta Propeller Repeat
MNYAIFCIRQTVNRQARRRGALRAAAALALLCLLAPGPRWAAQAVPPTVTQITPYLGDSYDPSISGDGTRIAFNSSGIWFERKTFGWAGHPRPDKAGLSPYFTRL